MFGICSNKFIIGGLSNEKRSFISEITKYKGHITIPAKENSDHERLTRFLKRHRSLTLGDGVRLRVRNQASSTGLKIHWIKSSTGFIWFGFAFETRSLL